MNGRTSRLLGGAVLMALVGCQSAPIDAYRRGEDLLAHGDLAAALQNFDAVAVTDLCYPEARLAAAAVERRLRRHKEQLLRGLQLRSEWRDDEAIAAFQGALDAWPENVETRQLIAATQRRRILLLGLQGIQRSEQANGAGEPSARTSLREPVPDVAVDLAAGTAVPAAPALEVAAAVGVQPVGRRVTALAHADGARGERVDEIGVELGEIEARTNSGELDQVLGDLLSLLRVAPGDARVTLRLARLLQQRGLMRYGQGQVATALGDLQRATELDPQLDSARVLFELAAREIAANHR